MDIDDIKIDFEELEKRKRKNFEDRLKFIEWWADYVKKHPEKAFRQHRKFVDAGMKKS